MRGRKPQTTAADADGLSTVPKAPTWLSKHARAEWRRVVPLLVERRILTDADLGALESYCTSVGIVREAQETLTHDGLIVQTDKGPKRHPAFGIMNAAQTTARLCAAELGLTPVSRSRPAVRDDNASEDDDNPLAD
jgi:P27 family predicted phage terminase small subunit